MNVYDSEKMLDIMKNLGYQTAETPEDADMVLLNTCHIREKAAEKVFSDLGRLKLLKQEREAEGRDFILAVTGCVVQAEDNEILRRAPYVDIALGPQAYHKLPEMVAKVIRKRELDNKDNKGNKINKGIINTDFPADSKFDFLPAPMDKKSSAFLAIQEGCDKFCAYCVVPYTRGIEYSRPVEDVLKEAKLLVEKGALEINLLGQNVNAYHGEDASGKERSLGYLIHKIAEIDEIKRIRYTTSYPSEMDDEIIEAHRDIDKIMPYLHLPIQAGSDNVLKAMNRRYSVKQYMGVVEKLRKARPDIGFASDFIVGFPGESDEDFKETLRVVNDVDYIQAYSFKYSPRPGTPAASLKNQVDEKIKIERLDILQELLNQKQLQFNQRFVGKMVPVLLDSRGATGQLIGRSPYMQSVHVTAEDKYLDKITELEIIKASPNALSGKI